MSTEAGAAAPASVPADRAQDPSLAKRQELLGRLTELAKQRQALREQIATLSGEQRDAARLQLRDLGSEARRTLGSLVDLIGQLAKDGADAADLSREVRGFLRTESESLRQQSHALQEEIAALQRQDQSKLDAEALSARREQIGRLTVAVDGFLKDLLENALRLQGLGDEPAEDFVFLDRVVAARATTVSGELKLAAEGLAPLREQLGKAPDADKEKLERQIASLEAAKDRSADSLKQLVALMKQRGLDDSAYSQLLIQATGQIGTEILNVDVAQSLFQHWLADTEKWARENGPAIGFRLIVILAILVVFWMLAKLVRSLVRRAVARSGLGASQLMQHFAVAMSGRLVILVGLLIALSQLDIEVGHMLAGLGIAGFIIGFALQDVLANFASGAMILIYRPYDVGDWIEVPDAFGRVQQMSLVSTTILTGDNQRLLVPNRKIWGSNIRNITAETTRRIDLTFGIGYGDDIGKAERIFHEILEEDDRVLDAPEPVIRLVELGESSVNFIVRPWCRTSDYWELRWHITRRVKERFDEEGVTIPFPQRDVHLYATTAPNAGAAPGTAVS